MDCSNPQFETRMRSRFRLLFLLLVGLPVLRRRRRLLSGRGAGAQARRFAGPAEAREPHLPVESQGGVAPAAAEWAARPDAAGALSADLRAAALAQVADLSLAVPRPAAVQRRGFWRWSRPLRRSTRFLRRGLGWWAGARLWDGSRKLWTGPANRMVYRIDAQMRDAHGKHLSLHATGAARAITSMKVPNISEML